VLLDLVGQRLAPSRGQIIELTADRDTENVEGLSDEGTDRVVNAARIRCRQTTTGLRMTCGSTLPAR
jgi:hypothetical protein